MTRQDLQQTFTSADYDKHPLAYLSQSTFVFVSVFVFVFVFN